MPRVEMVSPISDTRREECRSRENNRVPGGVKGIVAETALSWPLSVESQECPFAGGALMSLAPCRVFETNKLPLLRKCTQSGTVVEEGI
jgi:hypothetical protein